LVLKMLVLKMLVLHENDGFWQKTNPNFIQFSYNFCWVCLPFRGLLFVLTFFFCTKKKRVKKKS
jgi:hypothetical protein